MDIEIGRYLNRRLSEMGIKHLFGVAGDFNLSYLEQVMIEKDLKFIGNCNELNAAYTADGYARSNGFSALVTTYGVGDLSAINGIAGAYAENVPIVHISGIPPLHAVNNRALLHHTLVDGNYENMMNCMREFTVAQTRLTPENAGAEIDRVLRQCFLTRRPVYIQLPSDITHVKINIPDAPLDLTYPIGDSYILKRAIEELSTRISTAKTPVFLIDNEAHIFSVTDLLMQIAEDYQIPYVNLPTSKNIMDESSKTYAGTYIGANSHPAVRSLVENSDCLIGIGVKFADVSTGFFTHNIDKNNYISIKQYDVNISGENFPGLDMTHLLTELYQHIHRTHEDFTLFNPISVINSQEISDSKLTQKILWQQIESFLADNDVILGEVGTSNAGLSGILLPKLSHYISQPLWGSIGYTLPALLGSLCAKPDRRHVLFIGDGSFQLTAQELSTIVRHNFKPLIFVLNNGGYTIERLILGEQAIYNDIQNWEYRNLIPVFKSDVEYQSFQVKTEQELASTLTAIQDNNVLTLVELMLDPMDAPESLRAFGEVVARYDYGESTYKKMMELGI